VRQLGKELRRARKDARMTQQELASKAKVDRSFISDCERGTAAPSIATLFSLCKALGIAPSEVIRRIEQSVR
jgi:transcriptional regulator with XRE-family HTH domain